MLLTILSALFFSLIPQQAPADSPTSAVLLKQLSGVWRAPEDRTPRATELDEKVFGPGAVDVRNVTLTIQPSGQGKLNISTAVVGRDGRRYAPSEIVADVTLADPVSSMAGRLSPTITVMNAEERYLDGGHERWPLDGARVSISLANPAPAEIEFRFDTKEGRGSFGVTLKRRTAAAKTGA